MSPKIYAGLALTVFLSQTAQVAAEMAAEVCYGPGDVAGAVIGTLITTLALIAAALFVYKWYWRSRKGQHLVHLSDAENPNDQYAFDNPCFREATPVKHSIQEEKPTSKLEKNRWLGWSPLHSFGLQKNEKMTSLDDSYVNDSHLKVVSLKGHDFTGLGFNICGNMRDGIFVKDVLHRGPAFESGCINSGDRIDSVCISFRNMVFEDALTILSYASPYEVQVQVENDSHSRPSTLIRSKRESNAVSSAERIRHPKYNRSQSISHLAEIGKSSNKWYNQQPVGFASEKNRINQSLNKSDLSSGSQNDYPTLKITAAHDSKKETNKLVKNAASKSPPKNIKTVAVADKRLGEHHPRDGSKSLEQSDGDENKMQKFGIKVLPISINPKMGIQSVTGGKKMKNNSLEDSERLVPSKNTESTNIKPDENLGRDEVDNRDNVKTLISKGLHNLKEKINQNSLGRKKNKESIEESSPPKSQNSIKENISTSAYSTRQSPIEEDKSSSVPVPKVRSSVPSAVTNEQTPQISSVVPEEVTRAGDVARNNRKSIIETYEASGKKGAEQNDMKIVQFRDENHKIEDHSGSDTSSETGSNVLDEAKRPKRSKGRAPAPPQVSGKDAKSSDMNAITTESDLVRDEKNIFEPTETESNSLKSDRNFIETYDSDSDADIRDHPMSDKRSGTKIELSATQVTIHHSPTSDTGNDEEIETSRKAASLGDLSKLDSENTLSVVLERAVSLDLADGSSQCGKKRKAPLPPPEEFPTVFDEMGYRKEPRLENSLGLNTFQRRLKKSSDFGTLEDALQDGPKSLELEVKKPKSPSQDVHEANSSNIQEFSSWLAECRKQKEKEDDVPVKTTSKSLVNVNMSDEEEANEGNSGEYSVQSSNVTFSVNGKNLKDFETDEHVPQETTSPNNYTVLVISQPNSLEPIISEAVSMNLTGGNTTDVSENNSKEQEAIPLETERSTISIAASEPEPRLTNEEIPPKLPTSPIPVISKTTLSSPLSKSLTYVTEIKVSTSDDDAARGEISTNQETEENVAVNISTDGEDNKIETVTEIVSSSPASNAKKLDLEIGSISGRNSISELVNKYSRNSSNEEITVNNESIVYDSSKRGNDYGYETSRIPIRTMKSETGQKVLATIQSLAAKESPPKTPEVEYAKRVASLFSSPGSNQKNAPIRQGKYDSETSGFYLSTVSPKKPAPNRKIPPTVPPRKVDTSLGSGKSTVTVALSGKPATTVRDNKIISTDSSDRNIVTFSSFMPKTTNSDQENLPKIVNWKENSKDIGDMNGGHVQIESGVVHLPVKTSATKIVFENKDMDKEEL